MPYPFARATALALALFLIYNLNLRGIASRDTHVTEHLAYNLGVHGRADLDSFPDLHETGLATGVIVEANGHFRSTYPIVAAVLASPAYRIAETVGLISSSAPRSTRLEAVGKIAASATAAAACGLLLVLLTRRLPAGAATLIAAAAGLATPLWSSGSQALWSHAAGAFFLALGFLATDRQRSPTEVPFESHPRSFSRDLTAGAAFALAASCRPLLGFFLFGTVVAVFLQDRSWQRGTRLTLGALVVIVALAGYNLRAFGTVAGGTLVLESAAVHQETHDVESAWSANPLPGLAGILFSPSRGVLIYMPIAIVALAGMRRAWADAVDRWRLVLPTVAFVLTWSAYTVWWAGHSYGPRYAADLAVPWAMLAAADVGWWSFSPIRRNIAIALLAWSISVQAIGAFAYPGGNWNSTPDDVDRAHGRLWDWRDSQIPRTLRAGLYRPRFEQF